MANWKDYFSFSKRERNGTLALVFIIVGLLGVLHYTSYMTPSEVLDFSAYEDEIDEFNRQREAAKLAEQQGGNSYNNPEERGGSQRRPEYFNFDPNHLPIEKWMQLGLSRKQATVIHKYESKGGSFRKKEDKAFSFGIEFRLMSKLISC